MASKTNLKNSVGLSMMCYKKDKEKRITDSGTPKGTVLEISKREGAWGKSCTFCCEQLIAF